MSLARNLAAPARYDLPENMDPELLPAMWEDLGGAERLLVMDVSTEQVLYSLTQKFVQRYGQDRNAAAQQDHCITLFTSTLATFDLKSCLESVSAAFEANAISKGSRFVPFDLSLLQSCGSASESQESSCFVLKHGDCIYSFVDHSSAVKVPEGTERLEGADGTAAYMLCVFLWSAVNVLVERVSVVGVVLGSGDMRAGRAGLIKKALEANDSLLQNLSHARELRHEGNLLFKQKSWTTAAERYTGAIEASNPLDASLETYHCNRGLCSLILAAECEDKEREEHLASCVLDCTRVLRKKPNDIKGLYRRAKV